MATFTAQILVGHSHPYDGGINGVSHSLWLSENSVACWSLQPCFDDREMDKRQMLANPKWIPYPQTMLEDGLLLLGLHVWSNEELIQMADAYFTEPFHTVNCLNENTIPIDKLQQLHSKCRSILNGRKIILTLMAGSSLYQQLPVLSEYPLEIEVCKSSFMRANNIWTNQIELHGNL